MGPKCAGSEVSSVLLSLARRVYIIRVVWLIECNDRGGNADNDGDDDADDDYVYDDDDDGLAVPYTDRTRYFRGAVVRLNPISVWG